jgi:hypothetical protein
MSGIAFIIRKDTLMKFTVTSGSALAAAAATLLLAGAVATPSFAAEEAKGHCMGANACKGTSACKTAANACKGQNACKGTGFTETTKADCEKVEGAKFEPAK